MARSSSLRRVAGVCALVAFLGAGCGVKASGELADAGKTSVTIGDPKTDATTTTEGGSTDETTTTEGGSTDETTTTEGGSSDTTIPSFGGADIHDALVSGFKSAGLSAEKAECMATGYEKAGFTDPSNAGSVDPTKIQQILSDCHVSFADLNGGGGN